MLKIALDAGHYIGTPGKRTPSGVREWTLNNRVLLGFKNEIEKYDGISIVRTDDPSGKIETSLTSRTNKAKNEKCDILISFHHNAYQSKWGNHGGTETWIYKGRKSENLANALQNAIVSTLKLRNRGVKAGNMHMNREVPFPSALIEIGFMDSKTDHDIIVNEANSTLVGKNMAIAVAKLYGLKEKGNKPNRKSNEDLAKEVLAGKWGNNPKRKNDLIKAGYDYNAIQAIVNKGFAPSKPALKSNETVAREVIDGKWGNGGTRKKRLSQAGYNHKAIQAIVNKLLK